MSTTRLADHERQRPLRHRHRAVVRTAVGAAAAARCRRAGERDRARLADHRREDRKLGEKGPARSREPYSDRARSFVPLTCIPADATTPWLGANADRATGPD